jgi:hypothetical protein
MIALSLVASLVLTTAALGLIAQPTEDQPSETTTGEDEEA